MSLSKSSVTMVGGFSDMVLTSPYITRSLNTNIWSHVGDRVSQMTRVSAAALPMITRANASKNRGILDKVEVGEKCISYIYIVYEYRVLRGH